MSIPPNNMTDAFIDQVIDELKREHSEFDGLTADALTCNYLRDYLKGLKNIGDFDSKAFSDFVEKRKIVDLRNPKSFSDQNIQYALEAVESVKRKHLPMAPPPSSG